MGLCATNGLPCWQLSVSRLWHIGFAVNINVLQRKIIKTAWYVAWDAVTHVLIPQVAEEKQSKQWSLVKGLWIRLVFNHLSLNTQIQIFQADFHTFPS